jgi:hypothetical protein
MLELPDALAEGIVFRRLLVLAATEEVGVIVIKALVVAGKVPVMRTSC